MISDYPRIPITDLESFEGRAKHLYTIQTKEGKNVRFKLLESQKYLNDIIEEEFRRTKKEFGYAQARIINLKPRQAGSTTFCNIRSVDAQIYDEGSSGVIVAHDFDTTDKIYGIYKRAYDNLPEYVVPTHDGEDMTRRQYFHYLSKKKGVESIDLSSKEFDGIMTLKVKPTPKTYSGKKIGFEDTDSTTSIFTAGKGDTGGLGGTIRRIHLCIHEDSKIILSNGEAKSIKDVSIGETVICSDGTIAPIKNKFDTGTKETISIETWLTDEDVKVSKDHKILTDSGWKKCENITVDDYIQLPKIELTNEIKEYTYDLDSRENIRWTTTTGVKKHTFELNYDFGYLIGYYLAEGHVKYEKNEDIYTYVTFSSHAEETYDEKIIEDFGHLATSINTTYRESNRKITTFYGCYLANMLEDICGRTTNKHIPEWFFKTNKNFIEGVFVGYLAGDGSKTKATSYRKHNGCENWKPKNSAEKIHSYLEEYKELSKYKTIKDVYEEYGFSESSAYRYKKLFEGKSLDYIKEKLHQNLIHVTPEKIFSYLKDCEKITKKPIIGLHKKYNIAKTTGYEWRQKYSNKSIEYIRNDYGGYLANNPLSKEYNYITATSICEKITRQLKRLALAMNLGVPSIKFSSDRYRYDVKTKDVYMLLLSGVVARHFIGKIDGIEVSERGCEGKNRKWKEIDGKYFVKIKNIKKSEIAQTYDIEIDHHTHDFETPIGIVSNSESASYSKYKDLLQALNPSVPKFADNVFYVLESTANGTTGDGEGFYNAWTRATKGWEDYVQGKTQTYRGLRPVFIPWYMLDEYELPLSGGKYESIDMVDFGSPEEKQKFLEREQVLLTEGIFNPLTRETQVLTPEKINWYRMTIKDDCEFEYRMAQRFYPTTPEEAFIASSNSFFDSYRANETKTKLLNKPKEFQKGDLVYGEESGDIEFEENVLGNITIFEHPEPKWENRYVIGADISRNRPDGDYSTAYVKDRLTQEFVAHYHGKIDQDHFANLLMELGLYYNEALLAPESNLDMVVELIKPDGLTPYVGEVLYNERLDTWGYWTGGSSRSVLLDRYKMYLRDNPKGYDVLPDVATVDEHLSFVRKQKANGVKYEADEGKHDDRVIACAIANIADEDWGEAPREYKPSRIKEILFRKPTPRKKTIKFHELGKSW